MKTEEILNSLDAVLDAIKDRGLYAEHEELRTYRDRLMKKLYNDDLAEVFA